MFLIVVCGYWVVGPADKKTKNNQECVREIDIYKPSWNTIRHGCILARKQTAPTVSLYNRGVTGINRVDLLYTLFLSPPSIFYYLPFFWEAYSFAKCHLRSFVAQSLVKFSFTFWLLCTRLLNYFWDSQIKWTTLSLFNLFRNVFIFSCGIIALKLTRNLLSIIIYLFLLFNITF